MEETFHKLGISSIYAKNPEAGVPWEDKDSDEPFGVLKLLNETKEKNIFNTIPFTQNKSHLIFCCIKENDGSESLPNCVFYSSSDLLETVHKTFKNIIKEREFSFTQEDIKIVGEDDLTLSV